MARSDERLAAAVRNGRLISVRPVRRLHDALCAEILGFSPSVTVESAPFETRFATSSGLYIRVSPYRELFLVSSGIETPVEIRVSDREAFFRAMDVALECFLSALARRDL